MIKWSKIDAGLLVLRLGYASLLIGFHGWARLDRAIGYVFFDQPWTFVQLVGNLGFPLPAAFAVLSALSESLGALLVAAGVVTRLAAAAIAFNMTVAITNEAMKGDPLELPALYLLGAVVIAVMGPGAYTVRLFGKLLSAR